LSDETIVKDFRETGSASKKTLLKGIFGLSRMGSSLLLDLITLLIFYIYLEYYGLDAIFTGIGTMLGKFAIAISGFLMGYLSDRFPPNKLGRRKPFLIAGAPLLGVSFIMLFIPYVILPPNPATLDLFLWLTGWMVLFNAAYGALIVPYQSMLPETFGEKDRFGASLSENAFNFGGTLVSLVLFVDMQEKFEEWRGLGALPDAAFTDTIFILGIVVIIFYLPAMIFMPISAEDSLAARIARGNSPPSFSGIKSLSQAIKGDILQTVGNKNYVKFIFFIGLSEVGVFMAISALAGYVDFVFNYSEDDYLIVGLVVGLVSLGSTCTWWWMSKKRFNIHTTLVIGYLVLIVTMPFSLVIGLTQENAVVQSAIFFGGLMAGLDCDYFLQYVMLGNIVEEDERRTGKSHSGLYHGMLDAPENVFQGLAMFMLGLVLEIPDVNVGGKIFSGGYYWWGPVATVFIILGLLVFRGIKADLGDITAANKAGGIATSISLFKNRHPELGGFHNFVSRAKDFIADTGKFAKFLFTKDPVQPVVQKGKKIK
jgi:glycoside/pentoside/hexuronide:cation symporter, GPH family